MGQDVPGLRYAVLLTSGLVLALLGPGASQPTEISFAGETVVRSEGSQYAVFTLAQDDEVTIEVKTDSFHALLLLIGLDHIGFYRVKAGADWVPAQAPEELTAGTYYLYAVSSGPMETTLRFGALPGFFEVGLRATVDSLFERLAPAGLVGEVLAASPLPLAQRFSGTHAFDTSPLTGFMNVREALGTGVSGHHEYRWRNDRGVTTCYSYATGDSMAWVSGLSVDDNGSNVTLEYFRNQVSVSVRNDIFGFWVERAPGHLPWATVEPLQSPLWALDSLTPDIFCTSRHLPEYLSLAPL